jgi:hypothetical protein
MTDSPAVRVPLDPKEGPILEKLLSIRDHLELMKQDKSCFLKSEAVMSQYNDVITQVNALNDIRATKREEQNRGMSLGADDACSWIYANPGIVDTVLDDCLQLISLAFMTIGKNSEAPAM